MHDGKPQLYRCKALVNMQTSYITGKPLQGLMPVPNKGALTLNAPKVSDSKKRAQMGQHCICL